MSASEKENEKIKLKEEIEKVRKTYADDIEDKNKKIVDLRDDREIKIKDKERIYKNLNDERREKLDKIAEVNRIKIKCKDQEEKMKVLERKVKEKEQDCTQYRTDLETAVDKFHTQVEQSALFQK